MASVMAFPPKLIQNLLKSIGVVGLLALIQLMILGDFLALFQAESQVRDGLLFFISLCYGCYFIGSIPFGSLIARYFYRMDIRTQGSGNIGATNVWRICGPLAGVLTFVLDAGKAGILLFLLKTSHFLPVFVQKDPILTAYFAFLGHIFPFWFSFRGGKGIATFFGLILAWNPVVFCLMALTWGLVFLGTRQSFISGLLCSLVPVMYRLYLAAPDAVFYLFLGLYMLILWRHKKNISRYFDQFSKGS